MIIKMLNKILFKIRYRLLRKKVIKAIKRRNTFIITIDSKMRRIGKSTLLAELSNEFQMPILVKNWEIQRRTERDFDCYKVIAMNNIENKRGMRFPNGVLIEEGFTDVDLDKISETGIEMYGFIHIEDFKK